jgi:hypothetical protein
MRKKSLPQIPAIYRNEMVKQEGEPEIGNYGSTVAAGR